MREEIDKTQKRIYLDPSKDFWPFLAKVWVAWSAGNGGAGLTNWPFQAKRRKDSWLITNDQLGLRVFFRASEVSITGIFRDSWFFLFAIDQVVTKGGVLLKTKDDIYEFLAL